MSLSASVEGGGLLLDVDGLCHPSSVPVGFLVKHRDTPTIIFLLILLETHSKSFVAEILWFVPFRNDVAPQKVGFMTFNCMARFQDNRRLTRTLNQ